jgi:fumarate reductase flavoprotein subunit
VSSVEGCAATPRFDLIAIGGGFAGLTAACRAVELGARALVLESSPEPRYLCASRVNGGVVHLAFRSVHAEPDSLAYAIIAATGGFVEPPLARALARNAARSASWLARAGAQFTRMDPDEGWKDTVLAPLGFHDSTSFVWSDLGADRLMAQLEARLTAGGGALVRGARAVGLERNDDGYTVQVAQPVAGAFTYAAAAVVVADGGFHANADMLRRFVTPHPQTLKLRSPPSGMGDGIRIAEQLGARLVGMEAFYGHLLSADSLVRDNLCPFPFLDLLASAGMIVDANGTRFVDEGRGAHAIANALARHGDGLAIVVFDDAMWKGAGREFFCPPNPHLVEAGGTLHRAGDIPALARLCGVPEDRLRSAIEAHNQALARGSLDRLAPPRTIRKHAPQPFAVPPYYAAPVCAAITHTMGGIAVDDHARALDLHGRPIPGLYAAGASCGGLEGGPDAAYLGGIVQAVVFGLLAAEHALAAPGERPSG